MDKEIKARWVEALRSGSYAQGKQVLRSSTEKYCCLGVLCDIAVRDGVAQWFDLAHGLLGELNWNVMDDAGGFSSTGLTGKVMEWSGVGFKVQDVLMQMNDERGDSFNEIAQYIEENL